MSKGRYTSFFQSIKDPLSRLDFQNENLTDLIKDQHSVFKGRTKFIGKVLACTYNKAAQRYKAYIRIPEIHDHLLPEPCTLNNWEKKKQLCMVNHVIALSENKYADAGGLDYAGREVDVWFKNGGPTEYGKMRSARFSIPAAETLQADTTQGSGSAAAIGCYALAAADLGWAQAGNQIYGIGDLGGLGGIKTEGITSVAVAAGRNGQQPKTQKKPTNYKLKNLHEAYAINRKGVNQFANTAEKATPLTDKPKFLWRGKPTNPVLLAFADLMVQMPEIKFNIHVTSTKRTASQQASAVYTKLKSGGGQIYAAYGTFKGYYNSCNGDKACTVGKLTAYYEPRIGKSAHGLGYAIDISCLNRLTRDMVGAVLRAAEKLGVVTAMMETTPPHIHLSIQSSSGAGFNLKDIEKHKQTVIDENAKV